MHRTGFARFNVVASYATMERARRAIDALEFSGIDSDRISLQGGPAQRAAEDTDNAVNTTDFEGPVIGRIVGRALFWGLCGAVAFGLLGLVFGASSIELSPIGDSIAWQMGSWALFGLIIGGLWGAYSGISQGEAWELTFDRASDEAPGDVLVAVHSDNPADITRAEKILRDKQAMRVSQFDSEGHLTS